MKKTLAILAIGLESSSVITPELKNFSSTFKKEFTKELESIGAKLTAYSLGHFFVSGFFKKDGKCFYFSFGDVREMEFRSGSDISLLYRTARDEKDYIGGYNNWVTVKEGMANCMSL